MPRNVKGTEEEVEVQTAMQVARDLRKAAEPAIEQANKFKTAAEQVADDDVKAELIRRANVRLTHATPRLKIAEHLESYAKKGGLRA